MIREWLTDWLYWPMVVVAISGAATWTLNCVSVTYSEVYAQLKELKRLRTEDKQDG